MNQGHSLKSASFCVFILLSFTLFCPAKWTGFPEAANAASDTQANEFLPLSKSISTTALAAYKSITISVEEKGKKVRYSGVPLRTLFAEMLPQLKIDSMPDWKALSFKELVIELKGDDGYPGLVTATEMAINTDGDRFLLATERNGKPIETGVQLVCKADPEHVRWVRQVVSLRILRAK